MTPAHESSGISKHCEVSDASGMLGPLRPENSLELGFMEIEGIGTGSFKHPAIFGYNFGKESNNSR